MNVSLTDTYRPEWLDDVVGQEHIKAYIKGKIENKEPLPHLMFVGPAGVGKTTIARIIPNELHGKVLPPNELKVFFKSFNASKERNVATVRDTIDKLTKIKINYLGDKVRKIIFLDEMDAMTPESQYALRGIMEDNEKNCLFILSFNYINKVIDPIQDRCNAFRFKPIPEEKVLETISAINDEEKFDVDENILKKISKASKGSMRKALRLLETGRYSPGSIDTSYVADDVFGPTYKTFKKEVPIEKISKIVMSKIWQGYTYQEFVNAFIKEIIYDDKVPEDVKIKMIHGLGEYYIASGQNLDIEGLTNITVAFIYKMLRSY